MRSKKQGISPLFWVGLGVVSLPCAIAIGTKYPAVGLTLGCSVAGGVTLALCWKNDDPYQRKGPPTEEEPPEAVPVPIPPPLPPLAPLDTRELELLPLEPVQTEPLKMMEMEFEDDDRK